MPPSFSTSPHRRQPRVRLRRVITEKVKLFFQIIIDRASCLFSSHTASVDGSFSRTDKRGPSGPIITIINYLFRFFAQKLRVNFDILRSYRALIVFVMNFAVGRMNKKNNSLRLSNTIERCPYPVICYEYLDSRSAQRRLSQAAGLIMTGNFN